MKRHIVSLTFCLSLAMSACVGGGDGDNNNNNNTADTGAPTDAASPTDAGPVADTATPAGDTATPTGDTASTVDTSTPAEDTSIPPQTGLICPAIFSCLNVEMQKICPPTGATQECQTQAINTCTGQAETPQEAQWFQASLQCQIGCIQSNQGYNAGTFACMSEQCMTQQADCYSGGVYGAGGCTDIDSCAQGCQLDSTFKCVRSCFQASSQDASFAYHDISYCAQGACADKINTPGFEPCTQESVGQGGVCADKVATCTGQ